MGKCGRLWGGGFILINIFRSCIQYEFYVRDESNFFIYWYSGMGIVAAICLVIVCFSLPLQNYSNIVNWFGSKTMGIYLIHIIVRDILESCYNLNDCIYSYLNVDKAGGAREFLYTILYAGIIMGVSLTVIVVGEFVKNKLHFVLKFRKV